MRISDWSADVCSSDLRIDSSVEPSFKHPSNQYLIYLISIRPMDIGGIISPYDGKTDRRERAPSRSPRRALTTVWPLPEARWAERIATCQKTFQKHNCPLAGRLTQSASIPMATAFVKRCAAPSPEIGIEEHTSELQSLMRISYAVFCLKK